MTTQPLEQPSTTGSRAYQAQAFHLRVSPHPGELLSSFLTRAAIAEGTSPYKFCRLHLGSVHFWSRDVDRGFAAGQVASVAGLCGFPDERVLRMTLHDWAEGLCPTSYSSSHMAAIIPWVNAHGVFHRARLRHAQQFCPQCLQEGRGFLKAWRLSFMVFCPRHCRPLQDACRHCDAPIAIHRLMGPDGFTCPQCYRNLMRPSVRTGDDADHQRHQTAFRMQQHLLKLLADAEASPATDRDSYQTIFGWRVVAGCLLWGRARDQVLNHFGICMPAGEDQRGTDRQQIERSRRPFRLTSLELLSRIADDWPAAFNGAAKVAQLKRESVQHMDDMPLWMREAVLVLPGVRQANRSRQQATFAGKLRRLDEERPVNWRLKRASLLMAAARQR